MAVPDFQSLMLPTLRYEQLADLMIDLGVGVTTAAPYEIKRIDSDYVAEGDE
jgi:restriction endonuclease Mrr